MATHKADRPQRRGFGQRINRWLDEPDGAIFKDGKWRFWFPMVIGFSVLNAILTAMVFGSGGNLQTYMGAIMLSIGALLAWLCIGTLHYSDSKDAKMSRGVSALDSITLIFVIAHFCFLLWIQGHMWALQSREADYKATATAFNEKAEKISGDNVRIADAITKAAQEATKAARLENDTAYQQRRAAEAGLKVARAGQKSSGQSPALSVSPVELEKPDKPKESSTDFLTYWDFYVRLANFGELALAAITLIYIRNRSAMFNAQHSPQYDDFPSELDADVEQDHRAGRRFDRTRSGAVATAPTEDCDTVATATGRKSALAVLRDHLKVIAFHHPGQWFKADLIEGGVLIRMCERQQGREVTIAQTRQSAKLLAAVNRPDFRGRLVDELIHQSFPIEGRS